MDDYASQGMMRTASGQWVSLLDPQPHMIALDDILVAASRIIRFNGHSVVTLAEHSCRVHDLVRHHYEVTDPRILRAALMHDAHEAYVVDVPSPLKAAMREISLYGTSQYDTIENNMADIVALVFDFELPLHPIVKDADMLAAAIEVDMTWGKGTAETWGLPSYVEGYACIYDTMQDRLNDTWAGEEADIILAGVRS